MYVFLAPLSGCGGLKCGQSIKPLGGSCSLMGNHHNISKGHLNLRGANNEALLQIRSDFDHLVLADGALVCTFNSNRSDPA